MSLSGLRPSSNVTFFCKIFLNALRRVNSCLVNVFTILCAYPYSCIYNMCNNHLFSHFFLPVCWQLLEGRQKDRVISLQRLYIIGSILPHDLRIFTCVVSSAYHVFPLILSTHSSGLRLKIKSLEKTSPTLLTN